MNNEEFDLDIQVDIVPVKRFLRPNWTMEVQQDLRSVFAVTREEILNFLIDNPEILDVRTEDFGFSNPKLFAKNDWKKNGF